MERQAGSGKGLKIVIASAGRRAHYIEWFQEALRSQGVGGEVICMEYRPTSPGFGLADRSVPMPAYNGPDYPRALRDWVDAERPDLFFSMNDYELKILAGGLADELRALGCVVAVLGAEEHEIVQDKYLMAARMAERSIPTPATFLGSEAARLACELPPDHDLVVKHRFGSGSSGLQLVRPEGLGAAVAASAPTALDADGRPAGGDVDFVVVQDRLPGAQYAVDGVFGVDGTSRLLGVLARRKERMLNGDADLATSVDPAPFRDAVAALGDLLHPIGAMDIDFIEAADGELQIIDINPRLGGAYPFNHRAGADMPAALVRSLAGLAPDPSLLDYEHGVTTAKREEFTVISRCATP